MTKRVAYGVALVAAIFHVATAATAPLPSLQHRAIHLAFGLILAFLLIAPTKRMEGRPGWRWGIDATLIVLVVLSVGYIAVDYSSILSMLSPSTIQIIVAFVVTALVLEATRRATGIVLPLLGVVAIVYAIFGDRLAGLLQHSGSSLENIARNLTLSSEGVFGVALGVSSTYVVLFVLLGSLLQLCGAGGLALDLSQVVVGRFRGGPAKGATIASGLFASVSGSPVGNVAATGPVTIPMMIAMGFGRAKAAGVEAAASTGGMIMPPVMGATAFLIAEILAIPYSAVALGALVPALLYYLAILFTIDMQAAKMGLKGSKTERAMRALATLVLKRGYQLLPLAILVYMLISGSGSAIYAAFLSLALAALIALIAALVRTRGRGYLRELCDHLVGGFQSMMVIITACATAGIIMGMMGVTGLGFRLSYVLTEIAGGNVAVLLALTMLASIVLGMSLPAVAAYLVLAVTVAPALVDLGVEPLAAHLFVFYFGVLSNITPPVALAAYTAAGIAGAKPNAAGVEAVKYALPGFVIPFIIVFSPGLILYGDATSIVLSILAAMFGTLGLSGAVVGYFFGTLNWWLRAVLVVGSACLVVPEMISGGVGVLILILVIVASKILSKGSNRV
ncbi:MAG: TRAP transporter permease [Pseudoclavibacter sp.]